MGGAGEHHLVVDRLEDDLVVAQVDGGRFLDLPRWMLPDGLREGDVVVVHGVEEEDAVRLELRIDRAAADAARAEAAAILARLGREA